MRTAEDEVVRETDYDALSSRVSAYSMGYLPEDTHLMELTRQVLKYHMMSVEKGEFAKFAVARRLKKQFFGLFLVEDTPRRTVQLMRGAGPRNSMIPARGNHHVQSHVPNNRRMYKPPLINRGTYLRTRAVTDRLMAFVERHAGERVQVLSLGAGNDTRALQVVPSHSNVAYFELDFEATTRIKRLALLSCAELAACVNATPMDEMPQTQEAVASQPPFLDTPNYHLIPMDLRMMAETPDDASRLLRKAQFDFSVPTLIISECCLCYLSQKHADAILGYLFSHMDSPHMVMYEPIGRPDTNYGDVMVKNLSTRGIEMPTLMTYGTVDSQEARFKKLAPQARVWCRDMAWVAQNMVSEKEKERISQIEMLDEMEEFNLMNAHYCIVEVD